MTNCEWFALCQNPAIWLVPHPILGRVPTCDRCRSRLDLPETSPLPIRNGQGAPADSTTPEETDR